MNPPNPITTKLNYTWHSHPLHNIYGIPNNSGAYDFSFISSPNCTTFTLGGAFPSQADISLAKESQFIMSKADKAVTFYNATNTTEMSESTFYDIKAKTPPTP